MNSAEDLTRSGLVHDLNNVLQTLVDAADQLSDDPRWTKLSAAILRSVERGKNIAASIQEGNFAGVPFETILANAIAFVEDSLIAGQGPEIGFDCHVEPGIELAGNWAWERVLINLFLNAMRAMPQGGIIHVCARRLGKVNEIVVSDQGSGIPIDILEHLFRPHVSATGSSGLGLHIVETVVKQDGGEVRAANRVDRTGAVFTIRLPARAMAKPARA